MTTCTCTHSILPYIHQGYKILKAINEDNTNIKFFDQIKLWMTLLNLSEPICSMSTFSSNLIQINEIFKNGIYFKFNMWCYNF